MKFLDFLITFFSVKFHIETTIRIYIKFTHKHSDVGT